MTTQDVTRYSADLKTAEREYARLADELNVAKELERQDICYDDWFVDQLSQAESRCTSYCENDDAATAAENRLLTLLRLERNRVVAESLRRLLQDAA